MSMKAFLVRYLHQAKIVLTASNSPIHDIDDHIIEDLSEKGDRKQDRRRSHMFD